MLLKTFLFGLIFISPPFLKVWLLRLGGAQIGPKAQIGWFSSISAREIRLGDHSVVRPLTLILIDGDLTLDAYSEVSSFTLMYGSSDFHLGRGSYIGPQALINVDEPVDIGDGSALGARCMVFTHGSFLPFTEGYWVKHAGVRIEDKVWCAAGVFIHPGSEIGRNTFVNSMSVVNGEIPPGSIVEGNPGKVIYPMERVQRKMTPPQVDLALERILRDFSEVILRREFHLKSFRLEKRHLQFEWKKKNYRIVLVPSTGNVPEQSARTDDEALIYLVNCKSWQAPQNTFVIDLVRGSSQYSSDPFHTALRLFMLRYYGVRIFES